MDTVVEIHSLEVLSQLFRMCLVGDFGGKSEAKEDEDRSLCLRILLERATAAQRMELLTHEILYRREHENL